MITETLQFIGLSENEAKVYYLLLEHELPTTILAKRMNTSKGTVSFLCKKLVQKGIIKTSIRNNTSYFCAENPSFLRQYIKSKFEKEEERFIKEEERLNDILPFLESHYAKPSQLLQAQTFYYEGFESVCKSYMTFYDHLKENETIYSYTCPARVEEERLRNILKKTIQKRLSKGISCKMIAAYSEETAKLKLTDASQNRETLVSFKGSQLTMSETMLSEKQTLDAFYTTSGIVSTLTTQSNNAAIQIKLFKLAWQQAKLEDRENCQLPEFQDWLAKHRK